MSITKLSIPSIAIINQIQTLLKERYKEGFPVIKEIIQNANDGGASTLNIALIQNLKLQSPDISHQLLKRPALVFINDGDFSDKDALAISWFGADLNASDTSKVGKFGLGQKSIFHFCEAFFYLAKSNISSKKYDSFVNPWAEEVKLNEPPQDIHRPFWSELSSTDRQYLEDYLINQKLIQENQQFFVLWIPLRQESDLDRYILSKTYPNIASISHHLSERLDVKVATLLPMLRSLNTVNYWIASDSGRLEQQFSVSQRLDSESSDRDSLVPVPNKMRSFDGWVDRSDTQDFVRYFGREIKVENDLVRTIYDSPHWPKRLTKDDKGSILHIPDKSDSHCAVIISRTKTSHERLGKLIIQWAVFLPVADDEDDEREIAEFEKIDIDSEWDYTFLLHGYFFLDSGRRYIELLRKIRDGIKEVESPIARQWNEFLVAKGTLPLALSALWDFIENLQIPEEEISLICSAIAQSSLYKSQTFKSGLCLNSALVYRIHPSGNGWHLVDCGAHKSKPIRSFPRIPSEQIWQTLPQLSQYAEDYILVDPEKSNLFDSNLLGSWQSHEISQLIDHRFDLNSISDPQSIFDFIVSILESVSDKEQLISSMNKDAKFIQAKLVKRNTSTSYCYLSIKDLENAQQEKRIFTDTTHYSQDWATALAAALKDTQIFLVEQNIAHIIYGEMIRECDRNSCLDFLRLKPKLSNLSDRQNLLRRLI